MRVISFAGTEAAALADRLTTHKALHDVPRAELDWLVAHGEFRAYDAGEVVLTPADEANEMIVMITGCVVVYVGQGTGRRHAMDSRAGTISGLLPFSRLKKPFTDVLAEEDSEVLAIHRERFPEMIRECPELTESLVHNLIDRARRFSAISWQDEKAMSLGRLAAGLAHELNNPASAASASAKHLSHALRGVGKAALRVGMADLTNEQRAHVTDIIERCQAPGRTVALSTMDRFDLIDHVTSWLEAHGASTDCAPDLVDGGVQIETLDGLANGLPARALPASIEWIASSAAAGIVANELERATLRIYDVVSAVRDFTHLDRAAAREPTDVARSLADTVEVLRAKGKGKRVTVRLEVSEDLPKVYVVGADLNQAWSHLLENALDAVDAGGEVTICATAHDGHVVVEFADNGPGIPADIQSRIFDPFFTTKPVGSGTGLGLDIVRRVVRNYSGEVEFTSHPGKTAFRVRLPVEKGAP
jgi:signal transduction histidine kinase